MEGASNLKNSSEWRGALLSDTEQKNSSNSANRCDIEPDRALISPSTLLCQLLGSCGSDGTQHIKVLQNAVPETIHVHFSQLGAFTVLTGLADVRCLGRLSETTVDEPHLTGACQASLFTAHLPMSLWPKWVTLPIPNHGEELPNSAATRSFNTLEDISTTIHLKLLQMWGPGYQKPSKHSSVEGDIENTDKVS
jgi:hypothetical protein